ncbi:MAG TPA: HD domain-containing phosphohydrolase [Candidatus Methylomirabilis sp.]|jgi:HD-GYP domain-containing protein (c-di-GMP phosphodiesterase class II)
MAKGGVEKRVEKLTALLDIGKAMTAERDLDRLLPLIMGEVTKVMEADRSTLFLVDRERGELWSKIAQGLEVREIRVKIGTGIAGHVAATGRVVHIPDAYADPRFDRSTDRRTGYRTRSILAVPMANKPGEVIGVIQALNKREGTFEDEDIDLLQALSGQAAVAVENAILYEDIQNLFEGFIKAAAYAIETRDPTTFGHSERVATLTCSLAEHLDRVERGPYADVRFTPQDMRELRYASLLHDFGKVGVREHVLVKANKLYDHDLEGVKARFGSLRKQMELDALRQKVAVLSARRPEEARMDLQAIDEWVQGEMARLDADLQFILEANRPSLLPQGGFERIVEIARKTFVDADGKTQPILTRREAENLSIGKGTLNAEERLEIESHVTHSFHFLRQIPWTRDLRRIPTIAYAHHEKLNGAGYPNRLTAENIPLQARMMTVADVYDALTASDRPYKKAMPPEGALDILQMEAKGNAIDAELVRLFIESKTYALTVPGARKPSAPAAPRAGPAAGR